MQVELPNNELSGNHKAPFTPAGVSFANVSKNLVSARLLTAAISLVIPLAACVVLAVLFSWWWLVGAGVSALIFLWELWLAPRQVRNLSYAERQDDLIIRKGILFRAMVVVPYGRMQFVDVKAGPIDRLFGIAKVQLHTAASVTDAVIPGLPPVEAEALRDRLSQRGDAALAGM
jgi:membrane protein YdbS with pleckstrin-like domain